MTDTATYVSGNALSEGRRGWFVGHFIPATAGLTHQSAVELKWYQHPQGERRRGWAQSRTATTISVLISGAFVTRLRVDNTIREITLTVPGDYILFGPGVPHSWEALQESVVLSVRLPSVAGDQIEVFDPACKP